MVKANKSKQARNPSAKRRPAKDAVAKSEVQAKKRVSKKDSLIALLQRPGGTSLEAMMKATGWQSHSVRGFLAGTLSKKLKLKLHSEKVGGVRIYRLGRLPKTGTHIGPERQG